MFSSLASLTNRARPCKKRSWPHKRAAPCRAVPRRAAPCRAREATGRTRTSATIGAPLVASNCQCVMRTRNMHRDPFLPTSLSAAYPSPPVYIILGNLYLAGFAAIPDSLSRECSRARFTPIIRYAAAFVENSEWKRTILKSRLAILSLVFTCHRVSFETEPARDATLCQVQTELTFTQ